MKSIRLKNLRDTSGMTQQQVADKLGITRANYSHIENGRNEPDDDTTVKIAQLFNVSTDFLLGNDVDPTWATKKDTVDLKSFLDRNLVGAFYDGNELTKEQKDKLEIALTQIFWDQRKKERSDTDDSNKGTK
ncbi:hypothetical protein FD33_GL002254 [Companilactobacillus paralimentarius DSM 13238 = JCM 10415]|uniref:HTH cro/C1-type domain-containing protein n=1 Tax=Companilactobacillus paralimentarius DSM 13238 = JCM 10415 TaxID=1122151 RepID=A0A0R1PRW8_9LACO|nr:helix-turn-helix transcriptional regulator [Companilactobacillus paralimentarius]KAE9563292.1 hypothetical protein ATN96_11275 [Companilactobacillus paralimentarius]KRL31192.1 hypothetical protein FD33_GL002254 [Companilactobacillus paralimentarius DSM 13238 = JCM 10415]